VNSYRAADAAQNPQRKSRYLRLTMTLTMTLTYVTCGFQPTGCGGGGSNGRFVWTMSRLQRVSPVFPRNAGDRRREGASNEVRPVSTGSIHCIQSSNPRCLRWIRSFERLPRARVLQRWSSTCSASNRASEFAGPRMDASNDQVLYKVGGRRHLLCRPMQLIRFSSCAISRTYLRPGGKLIG